MFTSIKNRIKMIMPPEQWLALKNYYVFILSRLNAKNLNKLATIHNTDKWNKHWYTQHYNHYFKSSRLDKLNILEIGVGGYENPLAGGESLRMWKYYFPNSTINAIDIHDKSSLQESRINIFQGSQVDEEFLKKVISEIGELDIIIDDGSHINEHNITTFKLLFPYLKKGGFYVIEDTQTSYWPGYGGDSENLQNPSTAMNFFKNLTDCLNHEEFILPAYSPSYYDKNIISMHFYHNMVFIHKGDNNEGSNFILNNKEIR